MKDKFSDKTLNRDNLPECNQEPTENGKIKLLDVVALTQDVPEHNLKRGEVGTVVEILANGEAFEVEFCDDNGQMYKCLSFPASQLRVLHQEPIKADSKHQAHAAIEGYFYQILHSVNAWLDLADNDSLYLEVAEDFDIESGGTFTATQVKHTRDNITLRSEQVVAAVNNYWKLRTNNRDRRVKFRLLTKSKIVEERGDSLGMDKPGLAVWNRCSGDETSIEKISNFLRTDGKISEEVNNFLEVASSQEIYEQLIEPITWETDSKSTSYVEQSIRESLIHHGDRYGISPFDAEKVVASLITEAWRAASDEKKRRLTRKQFLEIFSENTRVSVPIQDTQGQRTINLKTLLDSIKEAFLGDSPDINIAIQSKFHIQNTVPQLLPDAIPREKLLTNIQTKLQSEGIAIIQGGTGRGKTTLANLTTKRINGDWSWLNFTNKDPSQVAQFLQQLSIAISNQTAQVNVALDDLNLQPQQLRTYEEVLGIVIYRVLERGAKLLITSQHKPPNNFIRRLGVSKAITVNISNFTISEIEQFAEQLGCSAEHAKTWSNCFQVRTSGHPRLVHALLTHLREKGWQRQDVIESILQTPQEVVEEREASRQLLLDLPEDRREFLYRLSLLTEFRKDYARNIGEIPKPIPYPGDVFSQLVGPWIDQVSENYYTISPLLKNAANEVWSKSKINDLHAQVANAILKANNLTIIEAGSVLLHSIHGVNKEGVIAVIASLMTASDDDWKMVSQVLSWVTHIKTNPSKELFPGDTFANYCFRSLQYRIAVEVKPEFAPKILEIWDKETKPLEIWDKETKPYEPHKSYLLSRLMLATQALIYYQVLLPAKQMVAYLREMIDITNNLEEVQEIHDNSVEQLKKYKTDKSNFFSILFGFIYARRPIYAPFLSELVDALDELPPEIRTLLLADFENDTIDSRVLVDGIWRSEADLENPDWTRCLQVFDKVIEKTIAWGYSHLAAAAARGKATIYDEYLNEPDTAHEVIQDFVSKARPSPIIEEQRAVIYLHQKRYKEALSIYERILPNWNTPSGRLDAIPPEGCRRAAMCAAHLGDWKKAAAFFEDGAQRTEKIENTERPIGFYADAGFAHFKAGNMLDSIKLLSLALQKFETIPQDNTDVKYFTLKKRLVYTARQMVALSQNYVLEIEELPVGFCSNPDVDEKVLDLPDSPIGETWVNLAQIEYKFGDKTTIFQNALQIADRDAYPILDMSLSLLEIRYNFRNQTFDNLPQRISQLAKVYASGKKHNNSGREIGEKGSYSISIPDLYEFAHVKNITVILVSALLTQLLIGEEEERTLDVWRANTSKLPIKENMTKAINLIESMLSGDENKALTVIEPKDTEPAERLAASLRIIYNIEVDPKSLFYAHTFIAKFLINERWIDPVLNDLADFLSAQWLKKISEIPIRTTSRIEKTCKSNETGKRKIGQILLAAYQAVPISLPPDVLQQFHKWAESPSK